MAYSYVRYEGDGTNGNFAFAFPYIDQSHVQVRVNGVLTSYTWLSAYTVTVSPPPAIGDAVEVRRNTPKEVAPVDFTDGSVLLERELDLIIRFNLYVAQEAIDAAEGSLTADATGNYNAGLKRITNLAAPVDPGDAVNKQTLAYEYPSVSTVADNIADVEIVAEDLGGARLYEADLGSITTPTTSIPIGTSKITTVADNIVAVNTAATNLAAIQAAPANAAAAAASATNAANSATNAATSAANALAAVTSSLAKASNLSDLTNVASARSNLGLATVASTGDYSSLTGRPTLGTLAAKSAVSSVDLAATLDLGIL